ncbi:MAG: hypothetical protein M3488_08430, partial [Actinomycetota bacterium]|nr:hypothetical protein [Actinomycetota bacterium]
MSKTMSPLRNPTVPTGVRDLVGRARGRLLVAGLLQTILVAVGVAAALASILVGVARYTVIPWAEPVAFGVIGLAVLVGVGLALWRRSSPAGAALSVDRRLGGFDRISTALELGALDERHEYEDLQLRAADVWASGRSLDGLVRVVPRGWLPRLVIVALAATLLMALVPSAADVALAERRAQQQLIQDEIDRLTEAAAEATPEVKETLEALLAELAQAETLEQAVAALGEARQELASQADPAELAQRTALAGLERRLQQNPLATGASAAEQLRNLAAGLANASPAEMAAAAAELSARAEDLAGIDQELSDALA